MQLPTNNCQTAARITRIALTAAICCWAVPVLTQAQEPAPTTKLKTVGKLVAADLPAGRLQLLIKETDKVLVVVDAKTKVFVQGKPSTLSALRNGDIIRVVTPAPGSRYASELHAARTETNTAPGDANVGVIRKKTGAREIDLSRSGALGLGLFDSPQQGVLVIRVHKKGPAAEAGVSLGDYIVAFDGIKIETPDQLISLIQAKQPNDSAKLSLWRERKLDTRPVVLTSGKLIRDYEVEVGHFDLTLFADRIAQPWLGVKVRLVEGSGIQVVEVESGSPAENAGIRPGVILTQFNGVELTSVAQLDRELDRLMPGARVSVHVLKGDGPSVKNMVTLGDSRVAHQLAHSRDIETAEGIARSMATLRNQIRASRLTAAERRDALRALEMLERQLLPTTP